MNIREIQRVCVRETETETDRDRDRQTDKQSVSDRG